MTSKISISRIALVAALAAGAQSSVTLAQTTNDPTPAAGETVSNEIIVTGTRATGITAAESAAPIKLLGAEAIAHVGQPNLNQVLTQLVPSFTAQAFGGDTANLTLSARLRGLSPNHTLVLVNGKRRHGTSNLAVLGGPYQGAASPDLDLISPSSIKRIEVLEQGAAAQYGSDAIAGVINIILKDDNEGVSGYGTAGEYYNTGGRTYAGTVHFATKLGDNGFLNATLFHRYHDFSQVGGLDSRATDLSGTLRTTLNATQAAVYPQLRRFPYVNPINGDAQSHLTNAQYNAGYDLGGVQLYTFGTYSRRIASAYENIRFPNRVVASPVLGVAGVYADAVAGGLRNLTANGVNYGLVNYGAPNSLVFAPLGFFPREKIREDDYGVTGGAKGEISGFRYDLSVTYGQDKNQIYTIDTSNPDLYVDTHTTPISFYDGYFRAGELTVNGDFAKEFDLGMADPLTFAFGAEYRRNTYQIGAGDPSSYYKAGASSYPGFRPTDAGTHSRSNEAVYGDVSLTPVTGLKLDGAVRYEHYSDFGSKVTYKATGRYDFSPEVAVRGTVSSGFRAPTLAESYYSATNVGPTTAFVQLPANSAAAKVLGFPNLSPEKSQNYSLGTVLRPMSRVVVTIDAYQVNVSDRILGTGSIYSSGGALNFPLVRTAVTTNGNILDNTVTQTGVTLFTNGASTRTRGLDVVASLNSNFGSAGSVTWTLSGNYNKTKVTRVKPGPTLATTTGAIVTIPLFDASTLSNLTDASPRVKVVASAFYTLDKFSATLRGTLFGKSSNLTSPDGGTYYRQTIKTAAIADIELNYKLTKELEVSFGANNLFNKKPPKVALLPGTTNFSLVNGGTVLDAPLTFSPYGINGGYYYGRINFNF